jgi:ABC-type phosphate/phosphonate transport system substrate-binding protein
LAYLTPHLGLLALNRGYWKPLVRSTMVLKPVAMVPRDSPVASVEQLGGRTVSTPDRLALVSLLVRAELSAMTPPLNGAVTFVAAASHASAMLMMGQGLADAAITSTAWLERLPEAERARFRTLHVFPGAFSVMFIASPKVPEVLLEQVRSALLAFTDTPEAAGFYPATQNARHVPLAEADLTGFAPLLPLLDEGLSARGAR